MSKGNPYTIADIYNCINTIYSVTYNIPYEAAMYKLGNLAELIARELRKRNILSFNGNLQKPKWEWIAASAPTKELARNVFKVIEVAREKARERVRASIKRKHILTDSVRNTNESVPANVWNIDANSKPYEGTRKSSAHFTPEQVEKLGDKFLVAILRQRGYNVTCTKTIEL